MSDALDPQASPSPPTRELPDLPKPFASDPVIPRLPSAQGSGCGKVGLLGCGVLILLFGLGMMIFLWKANDIMVWVFTRLETEISKGLPEDLPSADRARLDQAFEDFYLALKSGDVDPSALQRLQGKLMELSADIDSGLSREQVEDLTEALEGVSGEVEESPDEGPPLEEASAAAAAVAA